MPSAIDAYTCPNCGDLVSTVPRHSWRTAGRAAALFAGLFALWLVLLFAPFPPLVASFLAIAVVASFAAAVAGWAVWGGPPPGARPGGAAPPPRQSRSTGVPFATNRCKACGHRWR